MSTAPSDDGERVVDFNAKAGPWAILVPEGDVFFEQKLTRFQEHGGIVRVLAGRKMLSPPELFSEFAGVLAFPGYFGRNWDALIDCLDDLHGDWHGDKNVVLVIKDFDLLEDLPHLPLFVSVLCQAAEKANADFDEDGEPFYRRAIALHFMLTVRKDHSAELVEKLASAGQTASASCGYPTFE